MSFEPDNQDSENKLQDIAEESLKYLKVIAFLLADMQDEDVSKLINDIKEL